MLPIRFATIGLGNRLGGMLLLLLLEGAFLGSGEAAPLKTPGVDKIRALLESKNDPTPSRKDAPAVLVEYRRKVAAAVSDLPSLGDVGRALLLTEWNLVELGTEPPDLLDKAKEAVSEDDEAFERAIRNVLAMTKDSAEAVRAVITEIKHKARQDLLKRLEDRSRFYLRGGQREEDRIATANLLSDIMMKSRRQDRQEALTSLAMLREPTQRQTTPSARQLRRRIAELAGDLRQQLSASNPQVQVAAIRALSDLEIPSEELVAVLRPKLVSKDSPAVVRRAVAEALEHALARVLEGLANLMDESRPQPRVKTVEHILPVVVLGLADDDASVRRASIVACERAARILDELTRYQMPAERRAVFQPIVQVVKDVLPKLNDAARDRVPALRVAACRVLETLALSALRLRQLNTTRPPAMLPEPVKPYSPPPKEDRRDNKGVSLPLSHRGRRSAGPSQWATARASQPIVIPSPPRPLAETPAPAVTLERPIKLVAKPAPSSGARPSSSAEVRPAAFVAQRLDELPTPTPLAGFWNQTVQTMVTRLSDPDYRVRQSAVDVLETLGDRAEAAIPALVKALRDSNKFVRWGAARTLGRLAPRQADLVVPGLVALLNDREDIGVREKAVLPALEEYGVHAKAAVSHLARVINRGDKDYIIAVLHTIQSIGTDAAPALPSVAWILSDRRQPESVRIEAAKTLGRFGELARKPSILAVLRDVMFNEPDEDIRDAASAAVLAIDRRLK